MSRAAAIVLAALLAGFPLSAQMVTPELPVSSLPVPDPNTTCSVVSGATKAYAVCHTYGPGFYRMELAGDGNPILATRIPAESACDCYVAAGDALFYPDITETSVAVRRVGGSAEARIDAAASSPRLTWNGGSLLLLTYMSGGATMAAIIDTSLRIVVRPFAVLPPGGTLSAAASAGGRFLLVTRDAANATSGILVDSDGTTHAIPLATPPAAQIAWDALASSGSDYLHVWERDFGPAVAQRYSSSGEAIGGLEVIAGDVSHGVNLLGVVWTGTDYLIVWGDDSTWWMRTLGGTPQSLGNDPVSIAAGPAGVFLTTQSSAPQTIRRLDTNGPEHILSYGLIYQWFAATATDGVDTAVVWNEGHLVRIGRIAADGTQIDGPGVVLPIDVGSTLDSMITGKHVEPSMAFDGIHYLVVWIANKHVNGVFFGRDGVAGEPFVIADVKFPEVAGVPSVTWSGTHYLVTWTTTNNASYATAVGGGAVVTTSGSVTPFFFAINVGDTSVSGGPRPLVVYSNFMQSLYTTTLSGVFLDAAGTPFDIATSQSMSSGLGQEFRRPRVVSNGHDFLVTWTVEMGGHYSDAWVARLDDRGHRIGQPFLAASSDASRYAASAIPLFDGVDYRLVVSGAADMPLFLARITDQTFACGCLDDRVAIPIDFDMASQGRPIAASAGKGSVAVAYERWFTSEPVHIPRVMFRFIRAPRRRATAR